MADQWFERSIDAVSAQERVHCLNEAIRLDPEHVSALADRGLRRWNDGDKKGARSDSKAAIRSDPRDPEALHLRGLIRQKNDPAGAIRDFTHAIRAAPTFFPAFFDRALLNESIGNIEAAISDYRAALNLGGEDAATYFLLGTIELERYPALAMAHLTKAIQLDPMLADAYHNRAILHEEAGRTRTAIRDYQKYLKMARSRRTVRARVRAHVQRLRRQL